jgi:hypothetical protein
MSAALVLKMGGWASDVLVCWLLVDDVQMVHNMLLKKADDWHQFLRAFFATNGRAKVVPIFLPMICYSTEADS